MVDVQKMLNVEGPEPQADKHENDPQQSDFSELRGSNEADGSALSVRSAHQQQSVGSPDLEQKYEVATDDNASDDLSH